MNKKEKLLKEKQRAEFLQELTERVTYWYDKNDDFKEAYLNLIFAFSAPSDEINKN